MTTPTIPPPAFLKSVIKQHTKEPKEEKVIDKGEDIEKIMLGFSQSEAWELLKRFIEAKLVETAQSVREASKGSCSLEEVGFRYLAADQVNTFATQVISFVEKYERARRSRDESDGDSSGDGQAKETPAK